MPRAKYQFEDFLVTVPDIYQGFVTQVHDKLLQANYKAKMTVTKSTGFQLAYHQQQIKTTAGIVLIFFNRNDQFMMRLYGKNHQQYLAELNQLSESLVQQIDNADDCVKFVNPDKCWTGCIGNEFQINDKLYQKCMVNCFEFAVTTADIPDLMQLIGCESQARI